MAKNLKFSEIEIKMWTKPNLTCTSIRRQSHLRQAMYLSRQTTW